MPQYSQRHRRFALILWVSLLVGCSNNQPLATAVSVDSIVTGAPDVAGEDNAESRGGQDVAEAAVANTSQDPFADIYSSFASEMEVASDEASMQPEQKLVPPIEYLYEIKGGVDALTDELPSWLTGDSVMHFMNPVAFSFFQGEMYILDAGRHVLFRYEQEGKKLYSKMNLKDYLLGSPSSLTFDSNGYYFVAEPHSSRVLKFSPENKLVGVYKDKSNLSSPERLYYHEPSDRLYISDGAYSRIVVASRYGKFRFAIGSRGDRLGEFVGITDFLVADEGIYIADRLGVRPLQLLGSEGGFISSLAYDDLSISAAIAMDSLGRLFVADQEDDTIRIFIDNKLSWSIGGPGVLPGQFRAVTQMEIVADKLYVLDSQNRRIQVFQINDL